MIDFAFGRIYLVNTEKPLTRRQKHYRKIFKDFLDGDAHYDDEPKCSKCGSIVTGWEEKNCKGMCEDCYCVSVYEDMPDLDDGVHCVDCGKLLSDEEVNECGNRCFEDYRDLQNDLYETERHPDMY
jgi:hypothetical protein